jgi:hypothetical protein
MSNAAPSPRLNPLAIPDDETPDATYRRLRPRAEAELTDAAAELTADGLTVLATGIDGSLGTQQVWPSSDIDVLLVTDTDPKETIQWRIRDGYILHRHLSSWAFLTALRDGYPQSFIDTASGDWIRDPTWMLDGLATFAPITDPQGRLAELRDFFHTHRFTPEVVLPRRPLLLKRANALRVEAHSLLTSGQPSDSERRMEWAAEALAILWLEAAGRITSHKELDQALAEICVVQGQPEVHTQFRAAAGFPVVPETDAVRDAALETLRMYSPWLDTVLAQSPNNTPEMEKMLARLVYLRHRLWASVLAPARGSWLHLSSDQTFYTGVAEQVASLIASDGRGDAEEFTRSLHSFRESLSLTPLEARLYALDTLYATTRSRFV